MGFCPSTNWCWISQPCAVWRQKERIWARKKNDRLGVKIQLNDLRCCRKRMRIVVSKWVIYSFENTVSQNTVQYCFEELYILVIINRAGCEEEEDKDEDKDEDEDDDDDDDPARHHIHSWSWWRQWRLLSHALAGTTHALKIKKKICLSQLTIFPNPTSPVDPIVSSIEWISWANSAFCGAQSFRNTKDSQRVALGWQEPHFFFIVPAVSPSEFSGGWL